MRSLLILLVASVAFSHPLIDEDLSKQWEEFKTKYNKIYSTPEEETKRFDIFKENVEHIEAHNKLYENGQSTYTQEMNHYGDWVVFEITEHFKKNIQKNPTNFSGGEVFKRTEGFVLPKSVDWRDQGIVNIARDQIGDKCGSCWAFTMAAALEGQYALKTGILPLLSVQNLVDCVVGNHGCNGGDYEPTFNYLLKYGVESEKDYPYEARNGTCRYDPSKAVLTKISDYVIIPAKDELALQEAVATVGPIPILIDFGVKTGFLFYKSGIYDGPCSTTSLTHDSLLVGFGTENGQDFYNIKNSLGPDWGENGYYRVQRNVGVDKCCLAFGGAYPIL